MPNELAKLIHKRGLLETKIANRDRQIRTLRAEAGLLRGRLEMLNNQIIKEEAKNAPQT